MIGDAVQQSKRVTALRKHMHFCKNSSSPERRVIDERVLDRPVESSSMKQERWRRLGGDVNIWIQLELSRQMPRV